MQKISKELPQVYRDAENKLQVDFSNISNLDTALEISHIIMDEVRVTKDPIEINRLKDI